MRNNPKCPKCKDNSAVKFDGTEFNTILCREVELWFCETCSLQFDTDTDIMSRGNY